MNKVKNEPVFLYQVSWYGGLKYVKFCFFFNDTLPVLKKKKNPWILIPFSSFLFCTEGMYGF